MQQLVIANILEAHDLGQWCESDRELWVFDYRHFSGKALYWPEVGRALLVSHWPLDELAPLTTGFALPGQQREVVTVPMSGTALCDDALAHPPTLERILSALDPGEPVELVAWMSSPGLARLAAWLRARGFEVRPEAETIQRTADAERSLRERQPMTDLLGSLPEVAPYRPATYVAADWQAVRDFLAARGLERGWVVKGRDSVGGSGVLMVDTAGELARLVAAPSPSRPPAESANYLEMNAPCVIEEMIGERATNLSPTMDLHVGPTETTFFAVGWQVLQGNSGYVGIFSGARVAVPPPGVLRASRAIGDALRARGYQGYVNLDYVVTTGGRWAVLEMNLRRSSPIDHFHSVKRLTPPPTAEGVLVSLDYVRPGCAERLARACAERRSGVRADRRLGDPVTAERFLGLLLRAESAEALLRVLEAAAYDGDDNLRELVELARSQPAALMA